MSLAAHSLPGRHAASLMQRLTSRPQFQAVLAGTTVAKTPHFVLHRSPLDLADAQRPLFPAFDAWLGVLLPKRWAKRAVTRNSIRRQIYEVARLSPVPLPPAAYVVRLRSTFSRDTFTSATSDALKRAVRAELEALMARAASAPAVTVSVRAQHAG